MTPFAWLLGLILPACAATGAQGLPVPPPMDLSHIIRPASPNTALAAPAGFRPSPDIETRVYPFPADRLYDAIRAVAGTQSRTFMAAEYSDRLQAYYVVRSAVFNFPDLVTVAAMADRGGSSTLVIYSRSVYGRGDLGVNRARVVAWLAALDRRLSAHSATMQPDSMQER